MRRVAIVSLMAVTAGVIVAAFGSEAQDGFGSGVVALGAGLVMLLAWLAWIAIGVWRASRAGRFGALLTFGGMSIGGIVAAVDVVRRIQTDLVPFGAPRIHLMAPAVITVASATVVVLVGRSLREDGAPLRDR